jgi:outer membrane lipoprotein-sorting protein
MLPLRHMCPRAEHWLARRLPSPSPLQAPRCWRLLALWVLVLGGLVGRSEVAARSSVDPHIIMQRMARAYDGIHDYTALFLKRERINGKLLPLETIELRFQEPFKLYMAWRDPNPGRVITYVEGENDNKIHVNPGGMLRFVRLSLDPTSYLATRNAHHTIRQAGLRNVIRFIMEQYKQGTQKAQMSLHFRGDSKVDGRAAYHLEFICHADQTAGCYASRGEIWIDKDHYLPTKLLIYDWDNQLYEQYEYHRLRLNPGLGPEEFRIPAAVQVQPPAAEAEEFADP